MRQLIFLSVIAFCLIIHAASCRAKISPKENKEYEQVVITDDNKISSVNIENFTLITNNRKADSTEAIEILKTKRKMPLAMETKDSVLFESILSKHFTFRAENEFYNRKEYIQDRIGGTGRVDTVTYKNLVVQIFDNTALLSYRNILKGTDDHGKPNMEYYTWANYYIKEDGKWKVLSIHEIDARTEYPNRDGN